MKNVTITVELTDAEAWDLFVQRYSGPIYRWCCRFGLQDADARDVSQNVFAALLRGLRTFEVRVVLPSMVM